MRIRDYRPEDFETVWRLDQECFPPGIAYSRFELMHYIRRKGSFTIVVEHGDGKVAGYTVAECHGSKRDLMRSAGHIITIDVAASARRSGVGTLLMDEAESRMRERGCQAVYLETAVNNLSAITFYKRRGYFVLSTIPRYYDGRLDALVMGKSLVHVVHERAQRAESRET